MKLSLTIKVYPYCISFDELRYSLIPKKGEWVLKWNNALLYYFEDGELKDEMFTRRKYFKMMKDYECFFERMMK